MQLNEILEEHTIKAISKRTNISEFNIEALVEADFEKIKRVKAMGFISIIEREYNADLSNVKEQALEYYNKHNENESVTLGMPMPEEKKGKSKWFKLIVLLLIMYAIWYAFINYDQEKLNAMLPFSESTLSKMINSEDTAEEKRDIKDLSIENINTDKK